MSLEHAILGFLNYRQFSGYDLKKIFDTSVSHFWPADQSQIYRTLAKLSEYGWASVERVEQEKKPDRKEYLITEEGQKELAAWLLAPQTFGDHRSPQLIQVFFAGQLTDEQIKNIRHKLTDSPELQQAMIAALSLDSSDARNGLMLLVPISRPASAA